MHALEGARVKAAFQILHRFAQDQRIVGGRNDHVIARGLDPFDRIHFDAEDLAAILDVDQLFKAVGIVSLGFAFVELRRAVWRHFGQHAEQLFGVFGRFLLRQTLAHTFNRVGQLVFINRLHQVIDRVRFKRADCVFGVGGDENEQRRFDLHHAFDHAEAVETGHLNVEEHQIRLQSLDLADRLTPVGTGVDDLDIFKGLQAHLQALNGKLLVVDEDGANGHSVTIQLQVSKRPAGYTRRHRARVRGQPGANQKGWRSAWWGNAAHRHLNPG